MNTLEAILSFLILLSLLPVLLTIQDYTIDTSHYNLKLAEDVWRVLYLKNDLRGFDKINLNKDLKEIYELTSLCVLIEEEDVASCIPNEATVVIKRVAFINGNPKTITIQVGVNND